MEYLLPLARRWGIADDGYRLDALERATAVERGRIVEAIGSAPDGLWEWLASPEWLDRAPTNEYIAMTCLTMAYDQALLRPEP